MGYSTFVFKNGLLRGFKGEILDSNCDVDSIDLEVLAEECRAWAQEVTKFISWAVLLCA